MNDRSDMDAYSQIRQQALKNSWYSGGVVYSVNYPLQALDYPSHENMDAIIQICTLLYMETWI